MQGDVTFFNTAKEWLADGTFDLDTQTFKFAILDNTTTPTAADVTPNLADYTQVSGAGSYTTGGETLTNVTWVESAGTVTFDFDDLSFAANGSNDNDAYWGLVIESTSSNALFFVDLGGPVDMSTNPLNITLPSTGAFTLS